MTTEPEPTILDTLDPDLVDRLASRRNLFAKAAVTLGAAATAPAMLAAVSGEALGQGLPGQVTEVLNFALTLEYLEAEFYQRALGTPGLIPGRYRTVFQQIGKHENAHVRFLVGALGPAARPRPQFDYTARGRFPDVFSNFNTFATVSQTFEDLGVAAYKGQAGNLMGTPVLGPALQIHSVEARHAAEVRRVRGVLGWDGPFDRPLSRFQVLAAAGPFIVGA
jgi:hypothetical protein